MNRTRLLPVLIALTLFAAACGGETAVGEGLEGDFGAQDRLGVPEAPPPPVETNEPEPENTTEPEPPRDPDPPSNDQEASVRFNITAAGFDPYFIRVALGGIVEVINQDAQARSVTADQGEFDSGLLQPGESWRYRTERPGRFNFHDSTRPYVVGTLEVIAT